MTATEQPSKVWCTHFYESADPFEFCDIISPEKKPASRRMYATLLRPEQAVEPMPCVIALHGSMGWRGHHHEHIVKWLEQGIAVLRIHSFEARNVKDVVADQMAVTLAMMLADAFAGLALLKDIAQIDSKRVGISGWSLGGSVSLYAGLEPLAEKLAPDGARFAAHLPFYPAAHVLPEDMRWSSAPMLVLTGGADDYTPPHYIAQLAPLMQAAGADIEVVTYDNAHHAFDSVDPLTWLADAIRLGKKSFKMDAKGHLYLAGSGGAVHRVSTPRERQQAFAATRNVGAHIGVNWPARHASMKAAATFFVNTLKPGATA